MKRLSALLLMIQAVIATAQPIKDRIIYNDPSKYRTLTAVHAGAGQMAFTQLLAEMNWQPIFSICIQELSISNQALVITFIIPLKKCMFF